jgi:hypothetical protein
MLVDFSADKWIFSLGYIQAGYRTDIQDLEGVADYIRVAGRIG